MRILRRAASIGRRLAALGIAWLPWSRPPGPIAKAAPGGSAKGTLPPVDVQARLSALASRMGGGVAVEAVLIGRTDRLAAIVGALHPMEPAPKAAPGECLLWVLKPMRGGGAGMLARLRDRGCRLLSRLRSSAS